MKTVVVLLIVVGVAIGGAAYYTTHVGAQPATSFRTVTVKRDDLLSTIGATGTVEPEEVVDVGAQVIGRIKTLGIDPNDPEQKKTIDYGSVVKKGTVLARIDPIEPEHKKTIDYGSAVRENTVLARIDDAIYKAQVEQADAALVRARADLEQSKAKLHQAEQDWLRAQRLRPDRAATENKATADGKATAGNKATLDYRAMSDSDYDLAKANYEVAKANVAVSEAVIRQADAALALAKTNLDYTIIKSPVEGVIIDRRVNVGQTVVASLNAPSLFLIARDLRKMQVWASVNEADIGRIRLDMPVRFTIDAFSGEVFRGKVAQIRLNATMTLNVVTYTVVVAADNANGKLLPYLTANVRFEVNRRNNVLLVPTTALGWTPTVGQVAPEYRDQPANAPSQAQPSTQPATSWQTSCWASSAPRRWGE
jgi:HlyD family secretion protein